MVKADEALAAIEKSAKWEFLPIIGPAKAKFIERLVREHRPCRAVEVGSMTGYSIIAIASALDQGCLAIGIELDTASASRAEKNIGVAGLTDLVTIMRGDAMHVLPTLLAPVDFVLLDGQRSQYRAYLRLIETKFRPGTLVVANGTGKHADQCAAYLQYVRNSGKYSTSSQVFGDDAMEVSIYRG